MRICRWGLRSLCFLGVLGTAAAQFGCLSPFKALARAAQSCRIESEPTGATVSINGSTRAVRMRGLSGGEGESQQLAQL